MSKNNRPQISVFCQVKFLDGNKRVYQFPNDLRGAMLAEELPQLRKMLKGKLINVPISKYKNGHAKLTVARIVSVFSADRRKPSYLRTRGQFIDLDGDVKFLLHDHSLLNKIRILIAVWKWRRKCQK